MSFQGWVQVDAIGVKAPTVQPGDLVGTFTQHQNTEGITIERKESEARESATRRDHDLREPTNNIPRTIQLAAFFIF